MNNQKLILIQILNYIVRFDSYDLKLNIKFFVFTYYYLFFIFIK